MPKAFCPVKMLAIYFKLFKTLLLFATLFTTIVSYNCEMHVSRKEDGTSSETYHHHHHHHHYHEAHQAHQAHQQHEQYFNNNHQNFQHEDTSPDVSDVFVPDDLLKVLENYTKSEKHSSQKLYKIQKSQTIKAQSRASSSQQDIDRKIQDIFRLGNSSGIVRFNTSDGTMYSDQAIISAVRTEVKEPFKVQRSPDGKLNVVFNDILSLQATALEPNYQHPLSDSFVYPESVQLTPHQQDSTKHSRSSINSNGNFMDNIQCGDSDKHEKSYCTNVVNYPAISNDLRLQLKRDFANFFGGEYIEPIEIQQRMNHEEIDEEFLCSTRQNIIYPKSALTINNTERYIVNNDEFPQGVSIEECIFPRNNTACKYMESLVNNYVAECKQFFTIRVLASIDADGNAVTKEFFRFPSCCKCAVRRKQ